MNKLILNKAPNSYNFHQKHHGSNFYYFTSISTFSNSTITPARYSFSTTQTTLNSVKSLVARYYEPATAQFVTQDPMLNQTDQAYVYSGGNPVNSWDPSGKWLLSPIYNPLGSLCFITCPSGNSGSSLSNPFSGVSYSSNCSFMSCPGNPSAEEADANAYANFVKSHANSNNLLQYVVQGTLFQYYDLNYGQQSDITNFTQALGPLTGSEVMTTFPFWNAFVLAIDSYSITQLVKQSAVESLLEQAAGVVTPEFEAGDTIVTQLLAKADNKLSSKVESDLIGWFVKSAFPSLPIISVDNTSYNYSVNTGSC